MTSNTLTNTTATYKFPIYIVRGYLGQSKCLAALDDERRRVVHRRDVHVQHEAVPALQVPGNDETRSWSQLQVHHDAVLYGLRAIVQVPHLNNRQYKLYKTSYYAVFQTNIRYNNFEKSTIFYLEI